MDEVKLVMAAASTVVTQEELSDIAAYYDYKDELNKDVLSELLKTCEISENKKSLIYYYCFLYCRLADKDTSAVNNIKKIFSLPDSVIRSCQKIITKNKIDYIKKEFRENKKGPECVFKDNEPYVIRMLSNAVSQPLEADKKVFENLNSAEYEHPTDRSYLDNLNTNKTLERIIKLYSEYNFERMLMVQYTGSNIRATKKNLPYLYGALESVCRTLDVKEVPKLYVTQGSLNACTIGSSRPIIVISGICLSLLSYDELLFILGHEVGHIKSQHVLYHSIGNFLPYIANAIGNVTLGLGELAVKGIMLLLYQWYRMSELTADRAGLIACQNIDAAVSLMAKLSGYPPSNYNEIDNEIFLEQSAEFENLDNNTFDKLMKFLSVLYKNHPWTIMRAKELKTWYDSGEYTKLYNVSERVYQERKPKLNAFFDKKVYCTHCGKQIDSDDKFCIYCGKSNGYR
ncbi:MAG: M48 family metallopeptidase [Oscillospiraceae bacterium]|nr:M48 family metallopeptidase [Oscillospiraceae bacterium]